MRKIKLKTWKEKFPSENGELQVVDWNLLKSINLLINQKDPREILKGIDGFRMMGKIAKAFEKAEKTNELILEEVEYKFLKDMIEKDIPSQWGGIKNLNEAIESFMEAKSE